MRVIGLDLGTYSIKAVELETAFGRYEIRNHYEQSVQPNEKPITTAAQLLSSLPKPPDKTAVYLPSHYATQRNILVPTRDRKAVKAAVSYELEDDLPFNLDEGVFDYSTLHSGPQGSHIHIVSTLKKYLQDYLLELSNAGIDPDLITTESWAFKTYFNKFLNTFTQDAPVFLIHVGHTHTVFYTHWQNYPVFMRSINWGGADLTQAISIEYGLKPEAAEKAKRERGLSVSQKGKDSEKIECRGKVLETLENFLLEIRKATLTCKNLTQVYPSNIYISGGGSQTIGLKDLIEHEVRLKITNLRSLSLASSSGVSFTENTDATSLSAISLGICQVGQEKTSAINFRKGEFTKSKRTELFSLKNLRGPLTALGMIVGTLMASLVLESILYKSKINQENQKLEKSIKSFFPSISQSGLKTYLSNPSKLKEVVNKELSIQKELALLYGKNPQSPLLFLKDLSSKIPQSVILDMIKFQAGASSNTPYKLDMPTQVSLTFMVSNPQMIERLSEVIPKLIDDLQKSPVEETKSPDDSGKKFKITFTGKPKRTNL